MYYFRIFSHTSAYTEYMASENPITQNISYCSGDNKTYITPHTVPSTLVIEGASSISAETCGYNSIHNNVTDVTSSSTWSIISGSQYASINSTNGQITILSNANQASVTVQAEYNGLTATKDVTLTYVSGAYSETSTEIITDESGNIGIISTTVTENEDGSSTEVVENVVVDESGNAIMSTVSSKDINVDGSYKSVLTNYDAEGNAIDGSNISGDTNGNISTQRIEYDENL